MVLKANGADDQLGLEKTRQEYVNNLVQVCGEIRRVLKPDGTLWLNLGDSYAKRKAQELKRKDLIGIPWSVALALQADGWWLRSDIIWNKPNCMTESVSDRPTRSHEYIFLFTKGEKYYYDADAIKEPANPKYAARYKYAMPGYNDAVVRPGQKGKKDTQGGMKKFREFRNKRNVWTISRTTKRNGHGATFPEELPRNCIKAGSRIGDTVLDPFAGSGTTGKVALELGRKAILIESNPQYVQLIRDRLGPAVAPAASSSV